MFLSASSRIPFSMQNISIKNSISILLKIIFCLVCDWKLFFWFCLTLAFQDTLFPHHLDMQDGHRAKAAWLLLFTVYLQQGNFVLLCQYKEIFIWSQEQCMEEPSPTSWLTLVCNWEYFQCIEDLWMSLFLWSSDYSNIRTSWKNQSSVTLS